MEARYAMRKSSLYTMLFWVALGIFVAVWSYIKLGIGKFHTPGSGLMPFLLGVLFGLLALCKLIMALLKHGEPQEPQKKEEEAEHPPKLYKKLALIVGTLFAYAILIEPFGFLPITFLCMTLLFKSAGFKRWGLAAAYSAGIVLITYFLFTYLGVRFPPGILRALGLN
jgi:hypothetical protein